MALCVEIHFPLPADTVEDLPDEEHPITWIDEVTEYLAELSIAGELDIFDDGEHVGDVYVFFISGAEEAVLLRAASHVAAFPGVPAGAFAMVTDDRAEAFGMGRRVDLPAA
ncbi:hypothetical protein ACSNN8_06565 [Actinoplanes sp. URMC 104]